MNATSPDPAESVPASVTAIPNTVLFDPRHARPPVIPYVWMLGAAVAFSCMGTLAHGLRENCAWQTIALGRAMIPLGLTIVWGIWEGGTLWVWRPFSLWVRSLAGSSALLCTFYCFTRLPVGDVLTLTNLFPVWLAILSWPVLGKFPAPSSWVAIGVGVLGVALVQQPHFAQGNFATLVAVFSSLCSAVAMLGLHRLQSVSPRAIVMHFSGVSLLFCGVTWGLFPPPETANSPWLFLSRWDVLAGLVGVGVSATVGQFALTKAFTLGEPSKVAVVGLSQVAVGMLFDRLLWGRQFSLATLAGTALVLAPTAWLMLHRPQMTEE